MTEARLSVLPAPMGTAAIGKPAGARSRLSRRRNARQERAEALDLDRDLRIVQPRHRKVPLRAQVGVELHVAAVQRRGRVHRVHQLAGACQTKVEMSAFCPSRNVRFVAVVNRTTCA